MRPTDPVNLSALARAVLHGLGPVAADAGVALQAELPETSLVVPGDADQLRQVMTNLVENAIKYGGAGGRGAAQAHCLCP